jgi:hypothetical protein
MKIIDIKRTDKTPEVTLDSENQVFQMKGNCLPENIREFSLLVLGSLEKYLNGMVISDNNTSGAFRLHFRLAYFNSAAAKLISDVLTLSETFVKKGINIKNYWYFDEDDHDMLEAGEEIAQMVNVPMEFIAVTKD